MTESVLLVELLMILRKRRLIVPGVIGGRGVPGDLRRAKKASMRVSLRL